MGTAGCRSVSGRPRGRRFTVPSPSVCSVSVPDGVKVRMVTEEGDKALVRLTAASVTICLSHRH